MRPFDFIITFFSFIYALGLTHLLLAATHMIRHRREITFSVPHLLWMLAALTLLTANWISLWDFHTFATVALGTVIMGFVLSVNQYLICSLVTPDVGGEEWRDLQAFHAKQSKTYIAAFVTLASLSLVANYVAGNYLSVANWANENAVVLAMLPCGVLPLFIRARFVQIVAPLALLVLIVTYLLAYYPLLK